MQEENQGRKVSKKPREGRNLRDVDPQMHVDMDLVKWATGAFSEAISARNQRDGVWGLQIVAEKG